MFRRQQCEQIEEPAASSALPHPYHTVRRHVILALMSELAIGPGCGRGRTPPVPTEPSAPKGQTRTGARSISLSGSCGSVGGTDASGTRMAYVPVGCGGDGHGHGRRPPTRCPGRVRVCRADDGCGHVCTRTRGAYVCMRLRVICTHG
jgi:hypothetical protein